MLKWVEVREKYIFDSIETRMQQMSGKCDIFMRNQWTNNKYIYQRNLAQRVDNVIIKSGFSKGSKSDTFFRNRTIFQNYTPADRRRSGRSTFTSNFIFRNYECFLKQQFSNCSGTCFVESISLARYIN